MKKLIIAVTTAFALAACSDGAGPETESKADETVSYGSSSGMDEPAPPDTAAQDRRTLGSDRVAQGSWTRKTMAGDPAALFGEPQTEASFSVRCDNGDLVFTRSAGLPAGKASMALMAGGEVRTIDAESTPDPLPTVTGRLAAEDGFAAILAQTVDPIAVRIEDGSSLRMPSSAALREVVGGCRS